jgi:filamentous hemagglutinin family protein
MNHHASMNRIYRLVWSQVRCAWVPVAETAKGRGKSGWAGSASAAGRNILAAAVSMALGPLAHALPPAPSCAVPSCGMAVLLAPSSHPLGGQVVSGTGSITQAGNTTDIRQSSTDLVIDWLSFNIGPQETVDFLQPSASAVAVNRILGNNGSQILGHLDANGQLYLINPNGIIFGEGAEVNVGGLVASTLYLSDSSLSGLSRSFGGNGTGSIINEGTITAANGGYVALLGNRVSNGGVITARLGAVALAAGSAVTLDFSGNRLVHLQVDQSTLNDLAANRQLIEADGGLVIMTAGAKNALLASVVNNTGIIEARTVSNHDGTIELLGGMTAGTVNAGGTLDASAPDGGNGGFIETNAAHVEVANGSVVSTAASNGLYGSWLIDPTDFTVAPTGGDITGATLSSDLNSTNFTILSSTGTSPVTGGGNGGNINVNDTVSWSANTKLTLTAANNVNVNGSITASGATAALAIKPNTANGSETASGTGTLNLGAGASITLSGANAALSVATSNYTLGAGATINLANVSPASTTALVIGGMPYTVINRLGAAGSVTKTDLQGIEGNLSGDYALGTNINASATSTWNAGAGFTPLGTQAKPFLGTFDGLGHTISDLTIDRPATPYVGLFGFVGSDIVASAVIRNVGLVGGSVAGNYGVGGLAGASYGTISNSYATGSVTGASFQVGGLVGIIESGGVVSNDYATGSVTSASFTVGGLAGANYGSVASSYATGSVSGTGNVGGLVGENEGPISNSYATGGVSSSGNSVGGLVGYNDGGAVNSSYAKGNVTGTGTAEFIGGLVGQNGNSNTVSSSYATGNVTGSANNVGGLVGANNGAVSNSYATGSVSGANYVGGLVGSNSGAISSSHATTGTVTGSSYVGGLAGSNSGTVGSSYATGGVTGTGSATYIGGLVGFNTGGITGSNATGVVSGGNYVGGLVGYNQSSGTVSNSYATGAVSGTGNVGGLVGKNYGSISGSDATGNVNGTNFVGGLVGTNYELDAVVSNSYATGKVSGASYVGGLVGVNSGPVGTSYAMGSVSGTGSYIGGLVGKNYDTVSSSDATGAVSGANYVGGLVGHNDGATISSSYATGSVSGSAAVGGLVGYMNGGTVSTSYATGSVSGTGHGIGGLVGMNYGSPGATVSTSYATGNVTGPEWVGGLIGINYGAVGNSYATGKVSGTADFFVGGLVGYNGGRGAVSTSYSTGSVSGSSYVGGLAGFNLGTVSTSFWNTTTSGQTTSAGGIGMATAQMQTQANFTSATSANGNVDPNWDFTGTWVMYNGHTYPLLRAFMTPITLTPLYNGTAQTLSNISNYTSNIANPVTADIIGTSAGLTLDSSAKAGKETAVLTGFFSNQQGYIISYATRTIKGTGSAANDLTIANPITWSAGKLTLDAVGGIEIDADLDGTGTASLAAIAKGGAITQAASTAIDVAGASTLTANNGVSGAGAVEYDITLDNPTNNFVGAVTANGLNIDLADGTGGITMGNTTATGTLTVTSLDGVIKQAAEATVSVAGASNLTADNGGSGAKDIRYNITLNRPTDKFVGAVSADGGAIALDDVAALTAILASKGAVSLTSAGAMNVSGTIGTTLTTVTTGGTGSTTTFGKTTVGTSLDVTSTGAVTETSSNILTVAGAATTTAPNPNVCVNGKCDVEIPAP